MTLRLAAALLILWAFAHTASAAEVWRYEVGPWPVVSQLIGYRDRLWFVNSVKGVNHDSADLYSVALAGGAPRYERHLFSQDAGDPAVHRGLLYWPHEDARTEPGIGVFEVTDGTRWELGEVPTERAFHVHAMAETDGALYAAPSAWKGSIARSRDGGATWEGLYVHPTTDRRVSRITALAVLGKQVFGTLRAPEGRRLVRVDDGSGAPVPGWPEDAVHAGFAAHKDWLYGLVTWDGAAALWCTDGTRSDQVWTAPKNWQPATIASEGTHLWMAGVRDGTAMVWQSADGRAWQPVAVLDRGTPWSMTVYRGVIAVGGEATSGVGVLWLITDGPVRHAPAAGPHWPALAAASNIDVDWQAEAEALVARLADPRSYAAYGAPLRRHIAGLPRNGVPETFYTDRLAAPMPAEPLQMFGSIVLPSMADMGRWRVYWGMGLARSGHVRPEDILRPADYTPNGPMKFFSAAEIAMWAAGRLGHADREVLDALIRRLEDTATPLWLMGDAVGALTAITGQRFGYDSVAWRIWFDERPWPAGGPGGGGAAGRGVRGSAAPWQR